MKIEDGKEYKLSAKFRKAKEGDEPWRVRLIRFTEGFITDGKLDPLYWDYITIEEV